MRLCAQLTHLRRTRQAFGCRRAGWLCAAAALLFILAAVILILAQLPLWARAALLASVVLTAAALAAALGASLWRRMAPVATPAAATDEARRLGRLLPKLGSSVRTALELGAQSPPGGAPSLTAAHVRTTYLALADANAFTTLSQHEHGRLLPWRRASARLLACLTLLLALKPTAVPQLTAIAQGHAPEVGTPAPLMEDLTLTLVPPAYTALPKSTAPSRDGAVQALVGTQVTVCGRADPRYRDGHVRLDTGARTPMVAHGQGRHCAQWTVQQSGHYTFDFFAPGGVRLRELEARPIVAESDRAPEVALTMPEADVTLRTHEPLTLSYEARDDFGLDALVWVFEHDGGAPAERVPVLAPAAHPERAPSGVRVLGSQTFEPAAFGLDEEAPVCVLMEATDNRRPEAQVARSERRCVTLWTDAAQHRALLLQAQEVLALHVDWLALEIRLRQGPKDSESPSPLDALCAQAGTTLAQSQQMAQAFAQDPIEARALELAMTHVAEHAADAVRALENLRRSAAGQSFASLAKQARLMAGPHGARVRRLEQDVLYLDALLNTARMDDVQHQSQALLSAKAELQDALARYRDAPTKAQKAQLKAQMKALKARIEKLLSHMQNLEQHLSEGFENSEAQHNSRWEETLSRVSDAMAHDDIEAMAQDLEHLANMVDNTVSEMRAAQGEQNQNWSAETRAKLERLATDIKALHATEAALQASTQALSEERVEAAAHQAQPHAPEAPLVQVEAALGQARTELGRVVSWRTRHQASTLLENQAVRALEDVSQQVQHHAVAQALETLDEATHQALRARLDAQHRHGPKQLPDFAVVTEAHAAAQAAMRTAHALLEAWRERAMAPMTGPMGQRATEAAKAQREAAQKAQEAQGLMAELAQAGPEMGEEGAQALQQAQGAMQRAAEALGRHALDTAQAEQADAEAALRRLDHAFDAARQGQRQPGPPQPVGSAQQQRSNPRSKAGRNRPDTDQHAEVKLPAFEEVHLPQLRRDVLEAAKLRPPEHYEDATRRYHEALIR